jgi:hypothetical protein
MEPGRFDGIRKRNSRSEENHPPQKEMSATTVETLVKRLEKWLKFGWFSGAAS